MNRTEDHPPHKQLENLIASVSEPCSGIIVKFQGNILSCARYRSPKANFEAIKQALYVLTGLHPDILFRLQPDGSTTFEEDGGTVAYYKTFG